jgi:transposase
MPTRTFRPFEPDQLLLLPPSLRDWLPADLVEDLDLKPILTAYGDLTRGTVPYDPRMLVAVLLYAYAVGVPSSRQIARRLYEDIAFRVLAANTTPDFRTISDFRTQHLVALRGLFVQVLRLCQHAGLVKLGHIALDGTKLKANASKHKAMSYDRMVKEEGRLQADVDGLLQQATDADAQDDAQHGTDRTGDELPVELAFREGRLRKLREAKAALEQEAREAREREGLHPGAAPCGPGTQSPTELHRLGKPDHAILG